MAHLHYRKRIWVRTGNLESESEFVPESVSDNVNEP